MYSQVRKYLTVFKCHPIYFFAERGEWTLFFIENLTLQLTDYSYTYLLHYFIRKKDEFFFLCFHHIQVNKIFQDDDPETALEDVIDKNLEASYPIEDVYKVRFNLDTSMILS